MARKRSPLVSQFLENVSRRALEDYQDVIRQFVRRRHGIYVLYRKNRVQYIGLAQNLRNRIRHHLRGRYKGKLIRARVLRDGRIRFDSRTYNSPSLAAAAARKQPTANGWWFWTYERAPGEWVRLGELRR